jgi:hypothetical protein
VVVHSFKPNILNNMTHGIGLGGNILISNVLCIWMQNSKLPPSRETLERAARDTPPPPMHLKIGRLTVSFALQGGRPGLVDDKADHET